MARQGNWNRNYWKKLDSLSKTDTKQLISIMNRNVAEYTEAIQSVIPVLYGGLKVSVYGEVNMTEHGVTGKIGIDSDKHVDLNPKGIHSDDFTNQQLAEWLLNKPNKSQQKMVTISRWLDDFKDTTRDDIAEYWETKNGGKQ
jgi:hypothetical protein